MENEKEGRGDEGDRGSGRRRKEKQEIECVGCWLVLVRKGSSVPELTVLPLCVLRRRFPSRVERESDQCNLKLYLSTAQLAHCKCTHHSSMDGKTGRN
jgi:hypothetical protein